MSTDQSNNNTTEPLEEYTPSMEARDFFGYIMNNDFSRNRRIPNNIADLNFINSFLNTTDSIHDNSTDITHGLPINSTPYSSLIQLINNNNQSLSMTEPTTEPTTAPTTVPTTAPTRSGSPNNPIPLDISNNANIYTRFLEDILQLPPLTMTNTNNNIRRLLSQTLREDKNPIKYVLSEEGAKTIVSVEYTPETHPDIDGCPITMKEFTRGEIISQLPCGHLFNSEAILKWLKEEKAECPICRHKLASTEKKSEKKMIDSSNNIMEDNAESSQYRMSSDNVRLMRGFRPPRMPRMMRDNHLRRLMFSRQMRQEEEELQTALLASLEEQYMQNNEDTSDDSMDTVD